MGAVYHARDRQTGGDVALKVLIEREDVVSDRFAHEVEFLSALDHPHIVGYVSHGITEAGAPFLVMPWLDGEDLQARLDRGPLAIFETFTLATAVADALAYLHARGIVHRDLKPSNLFLPSGSLDRVKVIDLGIARATIPSRPLTLSGVLLGTPGFMAPEQARGDQDIAPTADIFSLGCVLFECLTGTRLFDGAHVMAILAKILVEAPPRVRELRSDVPDALDLLVHRMVAKEPERRPQNGGQLREWLSDLTSVPAASLRSASVLTKTEQRVVSVLVVVLPRVDRAPDAHDDVTKADADPFRTAAARFGVRALALDPRTAIALAPEGVGGADQAMLLARFARHVVEAFPGAIVGLATGSGMASTRLPVGEAIDRGVAIVRAAPAGGGVNVDEVSAALLTARFDIRRDVGRILVEDERHSLDPTRPLLGKPTSCVGRDGELAILDAAFADCANSSRPKIVLITSEAGTGKSRVRHEFVRRLAVARQPPRVFHCSGDPLHATTPYALLAQAIRHAASISAGEPADTANAKLRAHLSEVVSPTLVPHLGAFLGELAGLEVEQTQHLPVLAARKSAEAMRDQLRGAFEAVLRAWCSRQPVVLVLEDLHWADAASIRLLDDALRRLDGQPVFVLALARPDVHKRFPTLWEHRHVTELKLPTLPARACARIARAAAGASASPEDIERVVERSGGNAFYLEELLRDAVERPTRRSSGPPSLRPDDLPATIIAVAQERLERLGSEERKVLRAASIFGETFPVEGVAALVGERAISLEPVLAALMSSESLSAVEAAHPSARGEYRFRHMFIRAAAYASLTEEDRTLGHRLAAAWLEAHEDPEIVALHWLEGAQRERAAAAFARAGEAFWKRGQAEATARCAVRALLVGAGEPQPTLRRLGLLADALEATRRIDPQEVFTGVEQHLAAPPEGLAASGGTTIAHLALDAALEGLRSTARDGLIPRAAISRAARALGALSDFSGAKQRLASAQSRDDVDGRDELRTAVARVSFWAGEWGATAEALSAEVLPSDPRDRIDALLMLATSMVATGGATSLGAGLDFVSRAESVLDGLGTDPVAQIRCSKTRHLCLYFAGEYGRAKEAARVEGMLAHAAGLRYEECISLHGIGELHVRLQDPIGARESLAKSDTIAVDIGAERMHLHNKALVAYIDGVREPLEAVAEKFRSSDNAWDELHARYWLGRLLAKRESSGARSAFTRALDLARRLKVRVFVDDCTTALAELV